jgi:trypsin
MGTVIGWGMTAEQFISEQLRSVEVPYVDLKTCQSLYAGTVMKIKEGELCAGFIEGRDKDACQGDSGGPIIIDGRQAGITSMGFGCAQPGFPGVYADVAYYNKWILEQLSL